MRLLTIPLVLFLGGCLGSTTPEPTVITHDVNMPVTIPCVPANLGTTPNYSDTDEALKAAVDAAARYQLLGVGRGQRIGRLAELEATVEGCRKATPKP